jgi:hypothetical protein
VIDSNGNEKDVQEKGRVTFCSALIDVPHKGGGQEWCHVDGVVKVKTMER